MLQGKAFNLQIRCRSYNASIPFTPNSVLFIPIIFSFSFFFFLFFFFFFFFYSHNQFLQASWPLLKSIYKSCHRISKPILSAFFLRQPTCIKNSAKITYQKRKSAKIEHQEVKWKKRKVWSQVACIFSKSMAIHAPLLLV